MNNLTIQNFNRIIREADQFPAMVGCSLHRYRICPNCQTIHFVENKGRIYCSDACADEHYNMKRRLWKKESEFEQGGRVPQKQLFDATFPEEVPKTRLEMNIQILDGFRIDESNGKEFDFDDLFAAGLDFTVYGALRNFSRVELTGDRKYLLMGDYFMFHSSPNKILICKNLNSDSL